MVGNEIRFFEVEVVREGKAATRLSYLSTSTPSSTGLEMAFCAVCAKIWSNLKDNIIACSCCLRAHRIRTVCVDA
jgi:hypothetical protein